MISRSAAISSVCLGFVALLPGCSGSDGTFSGAGGATSAGGATDITGGATTGGGAAATGGASSTAGGAATGGAPSTGGAVTGGAPSTGGAAAGGSIATGGAIDTGGAAATGGAVATGGANTTGGVVTTGGTNATGGVVATGGSKASGGSSATGGSKAGGGSSATGGSKAGGGSSATGGNTNAGGAAGSTGCGNTTLPAACNTTTTGPCTLTVSGVQREYYVVLPSNYNASTAYPVVFAWHGLGGTAQSLLGSTYYAGFYGVKTTFPNAIYVTAQGLDTGTDDSGTQYGWANTGDRDVNFTKAMLAWLESNYCVDQNRLFSTGMSYGGMMSDTLGCEMSDVFRALGVMSGSLGFCNGTTCYTPTCPTSHPIAAWFTHGDADNTVPITGDQNARDHFIKNNGCDTTNTQTVAMSDGITTCTIYNVCTAGNYPVVWCPVPGEGHTIPTWAGSEIAKFFLQF